MKNLLAIIIVGLFATVGCSEISKDKRPLVEEIREKVRHIDANHRVNIVEDDFHMGDSIYKIRGYYMEEKLLKLVGVLYTTHIERDDYFYFENQVPIFSGHLVVSKDDQLASEYKYYYGPSGFVEEALYWKDQYVSGRQFPHEHFEEFNPNKDSLKLTEDERLSFFLQKLNQEGMEIKHFNENIEANKSR